MNKHENEKRSLRSWRYCVGARLKFWPRSRVPKKGSRDEAPPPNLLQITSSPGRFFFGFSFGRKTKKLRDFKFLSKIID